MPYPVLPLGLAYVAAYLREEGISVEILDSWAERYSPADIRKEIERRSPEIIGITAMTPTYKNAQEMAQISRRADPDALIVMGGAHPSSIPAEILIDCPEADISVRGEGEIAMLEICRARESGSNLQTIKGIAFRRGDTIVVNDPSEMIADLNSLPFPARDLFPLKRYQTHPPYGRKNPYGTMVAQRGCPFSCQYCSKSVFGSILRLRSVDNVLEEINALVHDQGVREIHFYDDIFTIKKDWIFTFCSRLKKESYKLSWSCTTRVDLVDEAMLREMKAAGCWMISFGVESGCQEILDSVRKGYKLEQVTEAFRITRKAGIRTVAYYMIGFPSDTVETIKKTVEFMIGLKPDFASLGIGVLLPGSELSASLQALPGNVEREKAEALGMTPLSEGEYQLMSNRMSREELESWARWATRKFYLRISYLISTALKIRSPGEFVGYLKAGIMTLKWARK